jgi:hypothetical protein
MSFDIQEITRAWIDSFFATDEQKNIAKKRNEICQSCPSLKVKFQKRKKISVQYCGECGCPISKKIFSRKYNACPLLKWETVDSENKNFFEPKSKKTDII